MRFISGLILFMLIFPPAFPQEETLMERYLENQAEGIEDEYGIIMENLSDLFANPLDFKRISRNDLSAITFLTENQINLILAIRDTAGPVNNWDDILGMISASQAQREILPQLIMLNDSVRLYPEYREPVKVLMINSWWMNIEEARGFDDDEGSPAFAGPQYGLRSRAQLSGRNYKIKAIAESDPGEAGFSKPDHLSAGVEVRPGGGPFRLLFGDYHFSVGQGLGFASRPVFKSWKADPHMQIHRGRGFGLHGSSDENRYLRGGAISCEKGRFTARMFVSSRNIDATIKEEREWRMENGERRIESFMSGVYSTGLHRTLLEIGKKNAVYEEISGLALAYRGLKIELGGLLAHFRYSEKFRLAQPDAWPEPSTEYRDQAYRYSVWGRGLLGNGMMAGEIAMSSTGGYALEACWTGFFSGGIAYSLIYEGLREGFFSHNTTVSSSIIKSEGYSRGRMNIVYQTSKKWKIFSEAGLAAAIEPAVDMGEGDIYIKSGLNIDQNTNMLEAVVQASRGKVITILRIKENDSDKHFYWQAETGFSSDKIKTLFTNPGTYLSARIRYQAPSGRLKLQAGISFFTGSITSSPFYIYEPDVYYGMSLPALSGVGSRSFLLVKYKLLKSLFLEAKISRVDYDDRTETGTSYDRIPGNHRTGVKVQMVYRSDI